MSWRSLLPRWLYRLRYGHAFPSLTSQEDPIAILVDLLGSGKPIEARMPTEPDVVSAAEAVLGLTTRPVYGYVGDLHPKLGRIGLIVSERWYRRSPLGVSRCDSGGLVGLHGAFGCIAKDAARAALLRLTMKESLTWGLRFRLEVFMCHGRLGGWLSYLRGQPPQRPLKDDRDAFIDNMSFDKDRRIWTWEARSESPIQRGDVEAIAITAEALKHVVPALRGTPSAFSNIKVIRGSASSVGVHHFDEENVVMAFMGR